MDKPAMAEQPITIIVAEELALVREGIVSLLHRHALFDVVAEVGDGELAWREVQRHKPEVVLLDLSIERMHALEVVRLIRSEALRTRAVILSARRDRKTVLESLRAGAQGFLLKSSNTQNLYDCIEQVRGGGVYVSPEVNLQQIFAPNRTQVADPLETLSAREYQVFTLMVEGVRAKEIAARLNLSPKTVDTYRASMMRKLSINDVASLVKYAIQKRLTTAD
jgi:DNA-binding NarL/FixJ family response regulator